MLTRQPASSDPVPPPARGDRTGTDTAVRGPPWKPAKPEPAAATIRRQAGPYDPSARKFSVAIPHWLAARFRRAARFNELDRVFPLLRVHIKPLHPSEANCAPNQYALSTTTMHVPGSHNDRVWQPKRQSEAAVAGGKPAPTLADVAAQDDRFRRLLLELLKEPNFLVAPSMTHTLHAMREDWLEWRQVPDAISSLANELDVAPPLYCLVRASGGKTVVDPDDVSGQLDDMSLSTGPLGHRQQYIEPLGSLQAEGERLADRVGTTYTELKAAYQDPSACRFRLTGSVGIHVYGAENIQGRLARALPASVSSVSDHSPAAFQARDLVRALETNWIKSTFCEAFPPSLRDPAIRAIRAAGFSSTHHQVKKFSVQFDLSPDVVAEHFAQVDIPYVKSLMFVSSFKVSFVYDPKRDTFAVSPKGLKYRVEDRSVRHTWVSTETRGTGSVPVMPRVRFGVAHAGSDSETWRLASTFVPVLGAYARDNKDALLARQALGPLPIDLKRAVSKLRMEFVESVVLARPSAFQTRVPSNYHCSVQLYTRYNLRSAGADGVPTHPAYIYCQLRHAGLTQALAQLDGVEEQQKMIRTWAGEMTQAVHGVAEHLKDVFVI